MLPQSRSFPGRPVVWCAAVMALVVTCVGVANTQEPGERKAAPSVKEQGVAEAVIVRLYAAKFKAAKENGADARALAAELLGQARATRDDDPLQFVAFQLASALAAGAGDHPTALEAVAELARNYKVDTIDMKSAIYAQAEKNIKAKEEAVTLTAAVLNLIEEALEADHFAAAAALLGTAEKAVARTEKLALASEVEKRGREVRDAKKAFDAIKPLLDQVAGGDAKALLEVGKYYCFTKGNYDKGLPLLAKCGDADLKALAERDLGQPKDTRKQVALGDAWYRLGEGEKGLAQRQTYRRALHWYQTALPGLEGLTRIRVEKEVRELAKLFPARLAFAAAGGEITVEVRKIEAAHVGGVQSVAVSDDGSLILSGGMADNAVRLWDAATGKKQRDFIGHGGSVQCVAISPDRKLLASGGSDNTLRLWNLETGQEVRRFNGHNDWVREVYFLPGGTQVLSACDDKMLRIFDLNTGNLVRQLVVHTKYVNGLGLSKDGTRALTGSDDKLVRAWDLTSGKLVHSIETQQPVHHAALAPDGKRAAATHSNVKAVKAWEVDTGKELFHLQGLPISVVRVAISPDSRRLFCGGGSGQVGEHFNQIRVFDLDTGKELRLLGGHTHFVRGLAFTPDGRWLVSCSQDGSVRLWGVK